MEPFDRIPSLFPLEACPPISNEAFNLFHSIDRDMYTRLIQGLRRDPAESMKVMAFWMWLEKEGSEMNLIGKMLSLPLALVDKVAEETLVCLKCIEKDEFSFAHGNEIALLPDLFSSTRINLRFFHDNRIVVLRGIAKIISTVCSRAFSDILHRLFNDTSSSASRGTMITGSMRQESSRPVPGERTHEANAPPAAVIPSMLPYNPNGNLQFFPPPHPPASSVGRIRPMMALHMAAAGVEGFPDGAYDLEIQRQLMSSQIGDFLNKNMMMSEISGESDEQVQIDDRTIFLTFSKGYPITDTEVREFFTRRFGDFIEDLIMQEVGEEEQVLYARMVSRSTAVINAIVGGNKAKYSINGKHVWARKYVKRQHMFQQQPPSSSSTRSPPTSEDHFPDLL